MMEYIKLFWEDAPEGEPSVILYEVDTENERLALHSIDIFADGRKFPILQWIYGIRQEVTNKKIK